MNRRGTFLNMFWTIAIIIAYIYAWIFVFGPILGQFGVDTANAQNMVGLEALMYKTLNIWAGFIPLLIFIVGNYLAGDGE